MQQSEEVKNLDVEMLLFYMIVALVNFFFYIIRHPIIYLNQTGINNSALFTCYGLDLFIFLSVLIPYCLSIMFFIIILITRQKRVAEWIYIMHFYILLSFFTKGMFLPQVYIDPDFFTIFMDNFAFFMFILMGPLVIIMKFLIDNNNNK